MALMGSAGLAQAQTATDKLYLQIDDIQGDLVAPSSRRGWIAADGLSWSVHADLNLGKSTGIASGRAQAGALAWSQGFDSSMTGLYQLQLRSLSTKSLKFEQTRQSGYPAPLVGLTLQTTDSYVNNLSLDMNGLSASTVSKAITLTVDTQAWQGGASHKVSADWDILRNTVSTSGSPTALNPGSMGNRHAAATDGTVHAYLRLEDSKGNSLAGFSTAYGYENWIEIGSAAWGVSSPVNLGSGGLSAGKPTSGLFNWTQGIDGTLPLNLASIVKGTPLGKAVIEYVNLQADGAPVTFMQQTLKNVYFSDIAINGDTLSEAVGFTGIEQTVWAVNATTGARGKATGFSYDVTAGKFALDNTPTTTTANYFGTGLLDGRWANSTIPQAAGSMGQITPAPVLTVPEPDGWALMLAGGTMLAALWRRRAHRG